MAYSALMAAALSGATVRQLGHWRRSSLLVAEHQTATRVFYSYRDIVALRTFVYLRESALSLQKIRRAVDKLRDFGELGHLSQYRLLAYGSSIVLSKDDEDLDLVARPGQLVVRFEDVVQPFKTETGQQVRDLERPSEYVRVDPQVRGGHPVIVGTRVPYEVVSSLVQDGVPAEQIKLFYPKVTAEAARSAVDFSRYVSGFGPAAAA